MKIKSDRSTALVRVFAVLLVLGSVSSWAVLYVSLDKGRTTPTTVSLAWLVELAVVLSVLLAWHILYWTLLWKVSDRSGDALSRKVALSSTPFLLAIPILIGVYGSDVLFHYLIWTPIPRALLLWTPPAISLVFQEAAIAWYTRLPTAVESWLRRGAAVPILIFVAFASLYIFTAGGHLYSPDEKEMYQVTESIAHGWLATSHWNGIPRVENGKRLWSQYGLVPSVEAVPIYWISSVIGPGIDPPSAAFPIPNVAYPLVDLLVNPLVTAATCALLYSLARSLGFRSITSLILVLAYGLGTSAWVYSKTFFGEPNAALFLLASIYFVVRKDVPAPKDYSIAGLMLGLGVGTRFELPLIAFPLGLLMLRGLKREPRRWIISILAFGLVFAVVCMATAGWYNWVKSGSIIETGYAEQTRGTDFGFKPYISLFGTFFSSGFGVFTFNPVTILGLFSLLILTITRRMEAIVFGAIILSAVVLYSVFNYWYGGYTWANRYMLLVLPLAVLPAGVLLERPWRTPVSVLLVSGSILLGIGINLLGVLFDWNNGWLDLWAHHASLTQIEFDPHFSTIGAHLRLLGNFLSTGAKLDLYLYYKLGVPSLVLFVALFVGFFALAARAALRTNERPRSLGEEALILMAGGLV